jgi:hypothetical protein
MTHIMSKYIVPANLTVEVLNTCERRSQNVYSMDIFPDWKTGPTDCLLPLCYENTKQQLHVTLVKWDGTGLVAGFCMHRL